MCEGSAIEQWLGIVVEMVEAIVEFMGVGFLLEGSVVGVVGFFVLVLSFYHLLYVCYM